MWLPKLASPGSRSEAWWRRPALAAVAVVGLLLAGCGGTHQSSAGSGPAFPNTPAGVQAQWFFQATGRPPIPDAAIRAHFAPAFLAQAPIVATLNTVLAGAGQLGLVSVTSTQPDSTAFVMSIRGGQRYRVDVTVDSQGLISNIRAQELSPATSPASVLPALAPGWVAQPVTFEAGGVTIHGTYTHPGNAAAGTLPAALLIAAYGSSTDRDDNAPGHLDRNTLKALAGWLSADGVASLRYDKLGSGQTGWGPYAAHPDRAGLGAYEQEAAAALTFLAGQRQVDRTRLAVFGHSEGGIYALLLAAGLAGPAPRVRAVGLLEPVPARFLDAIEQSMFASIQRSQVSAAQQRSTEQAVTQMITSLRRDGTLPPGLQPGVGIAQLFQQPLREVTQISRYDPAAVAVKLLPNTPVLLTCSNADNNFGCAQEDHLATGLRQASTGLDYVHLDGVDHFLKEDISKQAADYDESLPFSAQLRTALKTFLAASL